MEPLLGALLCFSKIWPSYNPGFAYNPALIQIQLSYNLVTGGNSRFEFVRC